MDSIEKTINLYLSELSGGNLSSRYGEYDEALEACKQLSKGNEGMEYAMDDLIALTERLAFRDGFIAGAKHTTELARLINN